MDNGWVKCFADGTTEVGSDQLVEARLSSWSRGRLDNITRVILNFNEKTIELKGSGQYWQSDMCEIGMLKNGTSTVISRAIYKQIDSSDCFMNIIDFNRNTRITFGLSERQINNMHEIKSEWINKWLKLELTAKGITSWNIIDRPGGM